MITFLIYIEDVRPLSYAAAIEAIEIRLLIEKGPI
jgi:hypothetical protein